MRTLILALIPGLFLACGGDETTTLTSEASGSSGSTGATTGDASDPTNPSDPSNPTTGASTVDPSGAATATGNVTLDTTDPSGPTSDVTVTTLSTDGTTTADTTGDGSSDTSTSDMTTGGGGLCGAEGPEIEAELVHIGVEPPACGAIEFAGQNMVPGPGPLYMLDGCPCGANCLKPDPWTFSIDVPAEWLPGILPACPRIVVERQMSKAGCELVGLAIWDAQEPEGAPAIYHAGSLLGPIAAVQDQLAIATVTVEECDCDDCCGLPTRFDLEFSALKSMLTLAEGQTGMLGDDNLSYEIVDFQSHVSGICDDSPAIDWVARRVGKP